MNPQTAQPDIALDRILSALRDAPAPTGMNQRIAARIAIAQAQSQRPHLAARNWRLVAGRLAPTYRYALAAIALVALALFTLHDRPSPFAQPNTTSAVHSNTSTPVNTSKSLTSLGTMNTSIKPRAGGPPYTRVERSPTDASATTSGPEARSISSAAAPTDPDALALAETLAPSRPIPPIPLTAEEHLLLLATRHGQPIELAELETLRLPALQARAEARQQTTIRNYIHSLLGPLAAAEAINPTPPSSK
jgi:hypothetical protein